MSQLFHNVQICLFLKQTRNFREFEGKERYLAVKVGCALHPGLNFLDRKRKKIQGMSSIEY